jgi:hypothetical protein
MVLVSFLALVTMSYFTPLWALWGAGVLMVFRYLEASGHHRSQHLLGHLAGHHHAAEHIVRSSQSTNKIRMSERSMIKVDCNLTEEPCVRSNDCIAAVIGAARTSALAIVVAGCAVAGGPLAFAQGSSTETTASKPPVAATYSGCVQKAPDSPTTLVISTPTACARLTGKVSADTLAGHAVVLNGILTPEYYLCTRRRSR